MTSSFSNEQNDLIFFKNHEDELEHDLDEDDVTVLSKRYVLRKKMNEIDRMINLTEKITPFPTPKDPVEIANHLHPQTAASRITQHLMKPATINQIRKAIRPQTQWSRMQDAVQEHFSSHITLGGTAYKLPKSICALKYMAKHSFVLYKKRECERRKRIRKKLDTEKQKEKEGKPANILLSMVDMCEICNRLYVTVNLFWGITLCDSCYFNPHTINEIMKTRIESSQSIDEVTNETVAENIIRHHKKSSNRNAIAQLETVLPTNQVTKLKEENNTIPPPSSDFRIPSIYIHSSSTAEEAEQSSIPESPKLLPSPFHSSQSEKAELFDDSPFDFSIDMDTMEDFIARNTNSSTPIFSQNEHSYFSPTPGSPSFL